MRLAVLLVVAGLLAGAARGQDALPQGCEEDQRAFVCEWTFDTRPENGGGGTLFTTDIPVRGAMLATVTVRMEGRDLGWSLLVTEETEDGAQRSAQSSHAAPADTAPFHSSTSLFVVERAPLVESAHRLQLVTGYVEVNEYTFTRSTPAPGRYDIVYVAEALPPGDVPTRPAATRADPHAEDVARDARRPEYDLRAAWLDDARVGDELFEAHLAVESLAEIAVPTAANGASGFVAWSIPLTVQETRYEMRWLAGTGASGETGLRCELRRAEGSAMPVVGFPSCAFDLENGTMHATIPEGFLGSPGDGVPIQLGAPIALTSTGMVGAVVEDEATSLRYDFALGGPAVWSALNPRLDPPTSRARWYEDPLASDNLPDTLSVVGSVLAGLTFLAGVVAVRARRGRTRALLARVDGVVEAHERDPRGALLALGELEQELARLYREGKLQESQYQLAHQRIAAAASRLAMRQQLGLDDGVPG